MPLPTPPVEFKLFGMPAIRSGSMDLTPSVRKSLALVAYLALEGATDRSRLADLLWSELTESDAKRNLRQELWRLQRSPLAPWLEAKPGSISLFPTVQTDVAAFRQRLSETRDDDALALYTGPLLEHLEVSGASGFDAWLSERREELASLWKSALHRHSAQLEAQGDLRGALQCHLRLLQADEFQEVHQRETMRLQLLLGERGAALERFERYKQLLWNELGLRPLPQTEALAWSAQTADGVSTTADLPGPVQDASAAVPLRLSLPLVGRSAEWAALEHAHAALSVVIGEAGVGKTRLAGEFAATCGPVIHLRAFESSVETPLYPAAEALRAALTDPLSRERLMTLGAVWRSEAARLVPELEPGTAAEPNTDGRARFLMGVAQALCCAAGPQGSLIFDDLHWADPMTLELLLHLVRQQSPPRPRLIATVRTQELHSHGALSAALTALERERQVCRVELTDLTAADVLTLIQMLSGQRAQLFANRLFQASAGNPLYLLESLQHLFEIGTLQQAADGRWRTPFDTSTRDYAELPLPTSVRDAITRRTAYHGPAALRLLEAASVSEDHWQLDDLAPALSLSDWEAVEALERLLEAGLVVRLSDETFGFSHTLVRRVLLDHLSAERRRLLHRRLADRLETTGAAAHRIAQHLEHAGLKEQAAPWRIRAGQDAAQVYAYPAALEQYTRALEDGLPLNEAFDVRAARVDLLKFMGELPAREAELREMEPLVVQLGEQYRTALQIHQATFLLDAGRYADALERVQALLRTEDLLPHQQALGLRLAGHALGKLGRPLEGTARLQAALALPGTLPPGLLGGIHNDLSNLAIEAGTLDVAEQHNQQALTLFTAEGALRAQAIALNSGARIAYTRGDLPGAVHQLEQALNRAQRIADKHLQLLFLNNVIRLQVDHGQLEQALTALNAGMAVLNEPRDPLYEGLLRSRAGDIHRLTGDLGQALTNDHTAILLADSIGAVAVQITRRIHLAHFLLQLGDVDGAGELLDRARALHVAAGNTERHDALDVGMADLALARGDYAAAREHLTVTSHQRTDTSTESGAMLRILQSAALLGLHQPSALEPLLLDLPKRPALRALALILQLRSPVRQDREQDVAQARSLLSSGQVPPLEHLELTRALIERLHASGLRPDREVERLHRDAGALQQVLTASLPAERRAPFTAAVGHWARGRRKP
ncbi:AAA family ATPase (plasmid) [Deinococcus sp. KNUC1210]|uniref:AAA family ATPase n=1 Tax=Deinococcus sp. KNUC1210 TaxID=2917691 RepID=UPI001EF07E68|nr:AAA family ATPase [Deinococcus sp. KNUC1210]ULH18337.1 AAA family ATPase [Deinococcus sp. KNUC1210]